MSRKLLAVIVAIIVAGAIFLVALMIATMFPDFAPKNLEYMTASERGAYFSSMPIGAYLTLAIGIIIAAVTAGWIATNVGKANDSNALPIIVAALLALSGLVWFFGIAPGQPWWLIVLAVILIFPFSLFGHRLARRW